MPASVGEIKTVYESCRNRHRIVAPDGLGSFADENWRLLHPGGVDNPNVLINDFGMWSAMQNNVYGSCVFYPAPFNVVLLAAVRPDRTPDGATMYSTLPPHGAHHGGEFCWYGLNEIRVAAGHPSHAFWADPPYNRPDWVELFRRKCPRKITNLLDPGLSGQRAWFTDGLLYEHNGTQWVYCGQRHGEMPDVLDSCSPNGANRCAPGLFVGDYLMAHLVEELRDVCALVKAWVTYPIKDNDEHKIGPPLGDWIPGQGPGQAPGAYTGQAGDWDPTSQIQYVGRARYTATIGHPSFELSNNTTMYLGAFSQPYGEPGTYGFDTQEHAGPPWGIFTNAGMANPLNVAGDDAMGFPAAPGPEILWAYKGYGIFGAICVHDFSTSL